MRFSEFNQINEVAPSVDYNIPAYKRAGKPDPFSPVDKQVKPQINFKDYQAQLAAQKDQQLKNTKPAVWKDPRNPSATASKLPPAMNVELPKPLPTKDILPRDPLANVSAGDPTMGRELPRPSAGAEAGAKAGAKSFGKKALGRLIPGAGIALDAEEAYRRYQKGDRTGAVISALGAAGGFVPIAGPAISYGALGVNTARDLLSPDVPEKSSNKASQSNTQPALDSIPAQFKTTNKSNLIKTAIAPSVASPSVAKSSVATPNIGSTRTVSSPSAYQGSAGSQSIKQANPDTIKDVNKIYAGDVIKVGGQDYTIKPGDTLDKIARTQLPATQTTQESNNIQRIKSLAGLK